MIGSVPSVSPGRNTAVHSSPLAACSDAIVTPCAAAGLAGRAALGQAWPEVSQGGAGMRGEELIGQPGQRGQRLPAVPGRAPAGRRLRGQAQPGQRRPDLPGRVIARGRRPAGAPAAG